MENSIPKWLLEDNDKRSGAYSRDLNDEHFLREMNQRLRKDNNSVSSDDSKPIIFFFGVPRCGKTFFSQMLVHLLDLGYPDNIVARFWQSPEYGIRLSSILKKAVGGQITFDSDYGKTKGVFDPHDFAYFWHELLKKESHPYDFKAAKDQIDWYNVGRTLGRFSGSFGKACLMKGVNPSYHINEIAESYNKSFFIYIKRDFIDSAVSLYRGRLKNYNDVEHWYGQTPDPELYHELKKQPYFLQIAGQFKYLTEMYEAQLKQMDPKRYMTINYKDFCQNPAFVIDSLKTRLSNDFDEVINDKNSLESTQIKYSSHELSDSFYSELLQGLEHYGLPPRIE